MLLNWMLSHRSAVQTARCSHIRIWVSPTSTFPTQPSAEQRQIPRPFCLNQWVCSVTSDKKADAVGRSLPSRLAARGWTTLIHYSEGKKCGLWLNFEGIGSYSRGERPIVLLHRTQRASGIPYSIANGVRTDAAMNWPADIFYELWDPVQRALLLIRGRMFTLFLLL